MNTARRTFLLGSMGLAATKIAYLHSAQSLNAGQVVDRIKANVGIPWRAQTVANLIAGTAETPVKGLATTMMATGCPATRGGGGQEYGQHARINFLLASRSP